MKKTIFAKKTSRIACFCCAKRRHTPNFCGFVNSHKTTQFTKVCSLESFPLYGNYCIQHQSVAPRLLVTMFACRPVCVLQDHFITKHQPEFQLLQKKVGFGEQIEMAGAIS